MLFPREGVARPPNLIRGATWSAVTWPQALRSRDPYQDTSDSGHRKPVSRSNRVGSFSESVHVVVLLGLRFELCTAVDNYLLST